MPDNKEKPEREIKKQPVMFDQMDAIKTAMQSLSASMKEINKTNKQAFSQIMKELTKKTKDYQDSLDGQLKKSMKRVKEANDQSFNDLTGKSKRASKKIVEDLGDAFEAVDRASNKTSKNFSDGIDEAAHKAATSLQALESVFDSLFKISLLSKVKEDAFAAVDDVANSIREVRRRLSLTESEAKPFIAELRKGFNEINAEYGHIFTGVEYYGAINEMSKVIKDQGMLREYGESMMKTLKSVEGATEDWYLNQIDNVKKFGVEAIEEASGSIIAVAKASNKVFQTDLVEVTTRFADIVSGMSKTGTEYSKKMQSLYQNIAAVSEAGMSAYTMTNFIDDILDTADTEMGQVYAKYAKAGIDFLSIDKIREGDFTGVSEAIVQLQQTMKDSNLTTAQFAHWTGMDRRELEKLRSNDATTVQEAMTRLEETLKTSFDLDDQLKIEVENTTLLRRMTNALTSNILVSKVGEGFAALGLGVSDIAMMLGSLLTILQIRQAIPKTGTEVVSKKIQVEGAKGATQNIDGVASGVKELTKQTNLLTEAQQALAYGAMFIIAAALIDLIANWDQLDGKQKLVRVGIIAIASAFLILNKTAKATMMNVIKSVTNLGKSFASLGGGKVMQLAVIAGLIFLLVKAFKQLYNVDEDFRNSVNSIMSSLTRVWKTIQPIFTAMAEVLAVIMEQFGGFLAKAMESPVVLKALIAALTILASIKIASFLKSLTMSFGALTKSMMPILIIVGAIMAAKGIYDWLMNMDSGMRILVGTIIVLTAALMGLYLAQLALQGSLTFGTAIPIILGAVAIGAAAVAAMIQGTKKEIADADATANKYYHAGGIERVPSDGYEASLHKDEAVLTPSEADRWRRTGRFADRMKANSTIDNTSADMLNLVSSSFARTIAVLEGISMNTEESLIEMREMSRTRRRSTASKIADENRWT